MSYVRAKKIAKRFKQDRRVSGADILRQELDLDENSMDVSLLQENSEIGRRGGHAPTHHSTLSNSVLAADDGDASRGNAANNGQQQQGENDNNGEGGPGTGKPAKISRLQMSSEDFEEWIKLATDNKINSTNSWNFALIDYFHEMSLLKEGDNINFQKASATLDGCVKIYSSRVDSIATETGRLLTGLATKKNGERDQGDNQDGDHDDDGENYGDDTNGDVNESSRKKKTNRARVVDSTLVRFDTIKMKKLDQELEIDPLFKRALSEFDEGGAKSLLLNILNINADSRVVFDAAGKTNTGEQEEDEVSLERIDEEEEEEGEEEEEKDEEMEEDDKVDDPEFPTEQNDADVDDLKTFVVEQPEEWDYFEICPSMKSLDIVLKDIGQAKTILSDVNNNKNYYPLGHTSLGSRIMEDGAAEEGYDTGIADDNLGVDMDFGDGDFHGADNSFGSVNNEIADVFANDEEGRDDDDDGDDNENRDKEGFMDNDDNDNDDDEKEEIGFMDRVIDKDLMAYFDQNLKANWAGPDHWKVSALKRRELKPNEQEVKEKELQKAAAKKKKQEFRINFLDIEDDEANDDLEEMIFKTAPKKIDLPKNQHSSETHNLLPKDIFFSSKRLLKLFCKPDNVRLLRRTRDDNLTSSEDKTNNNNNVPALDDQPQDLAVNEAADENYWAKKYEQEQTDMANDEGIADPDGGNDLGFDGYDNFDHIDDDNDDGANGGTTGLSATQQLNIGANLIAGGRRIRPEYVNFSRTAKRVDVRFLKDNLWKSLSAEEKKQKAEQGSAETSDSTTKVGDNDDEAKKAHRFTKVVSNIGKMYPQEERRDLSTSFCFICMLHLANEHGLTIKNGDGDKYEDLKILYNNEDQELAA
ncbi:condensin subunit [Saccharomycopsis crataegensis]|uniref:Condensin complex subunit 2 n=1 Tax=Saccharomycopsis crataegensis TaxID=43959 RepID=A0AAV5QJF2_9ASCO|nr:condensin subunit [Saccharomycopsis crataegensis]